MDEDITIHENDEPYIMYRKATEINYRLQYGIPLKTTENNKHVSNYNKILKFINKLLKQKNKEIKCLIEFKYIREDYFTDKEELDRIINKYGIPLLEEFNIKYKEKKKDIFILLKKLLKIISYSLLTKKYPGNDKIYYTISNREKNIETGYDSDMLNEL